MANFNPTKIEESIKGIDFPASKEDILNRARENNADQTELDVLSGLPDQEYASPSDITQALGGGK